MSEIKLTADSGGGTTSIKAPSSTTSNADVVLKLPVADGSANQVLKTDGSGQLSFTSNAGTTINNNADNRVITGSGTANTLNGESGLTYDSTTLVVSGSGEVKALSHTADNTDKKALFTTGHRDTSEENVSGVVVQGADGDNMVDIGGGQGSYNSATKIRFYTGANATTTTGTERLRINPNGNIGVSTTSPVAQTLAGGTAITPVLDLKGVTQNNTSGILQFTRKDHATQGSCIYSSGDDAGLTFRNTDGNGFGFYNGTASVFRISPTNGRLERSFTGGSNTDNDAMWFNNSGTTTGTFIRFWQTSGSYGANQIGSISHTANNTAYNTGSDYRLKENESPITDGITRLKVLKPYRFNFKADASTKVDGFFAHEVTPAVPEAITGEKDAVDSNNDPIIQQIDQSKLVPLLTAALQEAVGKIETLETKVAALEGA